MLLEIWSERLEKRFCSTRKACSKSIFENKGFDLNQIDSFDIYREPNRFSAWIRGKGAFVFQVCIALPEQRSRFIRVSFEENIIVEAILLDMLLDRGVELC